MDLDLQVGPVPPLGGGGGGGGGGGVPTGITFALGWTGTGNFADGEAVTITKGAGGLGTRTITKLYEDFATGNVGDRVSTLGTFNVFSTDAAANTHGSDFVTSTNVVRSGFARSGHFRLAPLDDYPPSVKKLLASATQEIYLSYWLKVVKNVANAAHTLVGIKTFALAGNTDAGQTMDFNNAPGGQIGGIESAFDGAVEKATYYRASIAARDAQGPVLHALLLDPGQIANNPGNVAGSEARPFEQFMRFEFYVRLSNPAGTANGALSWRVESMQPQLTPTQWLTIYDNDHEESAPSTWETVNTLDDHDVSYPSGIRGVSMGAYFAATASADYSLYFSDVLVNYGTNAAKRLEISDNLTAWGAYGPTARNVSEVQHSLSAWSDTTAAFTIAKKGHTSLSGKHLWCVTGQHAAERVGTFD